MEFQDRCLDPDLVLKKSWIRFFMRGWIRIRSIKTGIRSKILPENTRIYIFMLKQKQKGMLHNLFYLHNIEDLENLQYLL